MKPKFLMIIIVLFLAIALAAAKGKCADCHTGAVYWHDALGFSKDVEDLQKKSANQLLHDNLKITFGCISFDGDAVLIVQEFQGYNGENKPSDYTILPKAMIEKIVPLLDKKEAPSEKPNALPLHRPDASGSLASGGTGLHSPDRLATAGKRLLPRPENERRHR